MRTIFYEKLREDVESALYDSKYLGRVILETVTRRNDVMMTGIMVITNGNPVSPVVYLNDYYESFVQGKSYSDILEQVVGTLRRTRIPNIVPESLLSFDQIKPNVFIRISDPKQNQHWLEDKVYHLVDNLAWTYQFSVDIPGFDATIPIRPEHLEAWGVTAAEIKTIAEDNLRREKVVLTPMSSLLDSIITDSDPENIYDFEGDFMALGSEELYMLKVDRSPFGATVLLRSDTMKRVGKIFDDDFYIIPSSQYEILTLPVKKAPAFAALQTMLKDINKTEIEPQDRLSDEMFYYDRECERVMKAVDYFAEKLGVSKEEMDCEKLEKKKYRDEPER